MLLVVLGSLLSAGGCRKDSPPPIDICLHDGLGGGDCQLREGSRLKACCIKESAGWYCPPSCLENVWMTTPEDMEAYAAWAYGTSRSKVRPTLRNLERSIR